MSNIENQMSEKHMPTSEYVDEAKVEQRPEVVEATPAEEAALIRKLDWHLLPFVFVLYSLSVLDRSNLGNAKLAGLQKDIDLTGYKYNWLGTLFYISYILSQWTITGWKRFPPHIWATIVVFCWGFIATIQATVFNWQGLMACRFFLGIFEAMFGPGVPLYLSFFYPRDKIGFRQGIFISGAAMANAYGGALAYGLSHIKGSIASWKILFIIEGVPTCLISILVWFYLPDSIQSARFLSEREKQVASIFVARNQQADPDRKDKFQIKEFLAAFQEPKSIFPAIMYFATNVSYASLPLFLPTIIADIGVFSSIQSNGLSAPPYLLVFFTILVTSWFSDRLRVRGPFIFLTAVIAAIGFILLATTKSVAARYVGCFLAVNIFCCVALNLAWVSNIHSTESKRAGGMVILQTIGQCGPLLGTNVFPATEAPYYRKGMWISAAMCLVVAGTSAILSSILIWENRKMEKEGLIAPKNAAPESGSQGREATYPRYRYIW